MLSKNPEFRKFTLVYLLITFIINALTFIIFGESIAYTLLLSFIAYISFYIYTFHRYKRIEKLTAEIEKILHGDYSVKISSFNEGELSILENETGKMFSRLREQNEMLEKDRVFLADSIADISHQLRTPLTSINLIVSLLSSGDINEERRNELLRELTKLIGKTETLVTVLLKISKIDAGTVDFEKKEVSLLSLIQKSAEGIMIPMDIKNQTFEINCKDEKIVCDPVWTAEALGNIFKNAMEHTPNGGKLTVTAEDTPIFTEIVITDTGNGFDEEDMPHIFERFYKGKNSSKDSFGIGLNLAKMIITEQNGTIQANNSSTGGAKFTIRLYKQVV